MFISICIFNYSELNFNIKINKRQQKAIKRAKKKENTQKMSKINKIKINELQLLALTHLTIGKPLLNRGFLLFFVEILYPKDIDRRIIEYLIMFLKKQKLKIASSTYFRIRTRQKILPEDPANLINFFDDLLFLLL